MKYTYTMSGIYLTEPEYKEFKQLSDKGICPFCNKTYSKQYGAFKKHRLACPDKQKYAARTLDESV